MADVTNGQTGPRFFRPAETAVFIFSYFLLSGSSWRDLYSWWDAAFLNNIYKNIFRNYVWKKQSSQVNQTIIRAYEYI